MRVLKDTYGLTWAQITRISDFYGIPKRTLSAIYSGKRGVPRKWRKRLGEPELVLVPLERVYDPLTQVVKPKPRQREHNPRIAVRKDDMRSAAQTLISNLWSDDLRELADLLTAHLIR